MRAFADVRHGTDPPNAPPGEYIAVMYSSAFANLTAARETVIIVKEDDGAWRTVGYFIQPEGGGAR